MGVLSCLRPEEACSVGRMEKERQGVGAIREAGKRQGKEKDQHRSLGFMDQTRIPRLEGVTCCR